MNYWIIAGIVFSALAVISTGIGSYKQQKVDSEKDSKIEKFHEINEKRQLEIIDISKNTQNESSKLNTKVDINHESTKEILLNTQDNIQSSIKPDILLTNIGTDKTKKKYIFQIINYGNSTASLVELKLKYSLPCGEITLSQKDIPKDEKYNFTYDILPLYSMITKSNQTDKMNEWKKGYDKHIEDFNNGKKVLIVNIELIYYWGKEESIIKTYYLIHTIEGIQLIKN